MPLVSLDIAFIQMMAYLVASSASHKPLFIHLQYTHYPSQGNSESRAYEWTGNSPYEHFSAANSLTTVFRYPVNICTSQNS